MCFTALLPSIEMFNLPTFLFVTPMFLFSGTFFPLESLPIWAQNAALAFPLTHLVTVVRSLGRGYWDPVLLWNILYLAVFSLVFYPLALMLTRRRLIK